MNQSDEQTSRKNQIIKEVFLSAFEELLDEMPFDKISTSEIIERSGLSRTTFYKHFRDKYELATWRYRQMMKAAMGSGYNSLEDSYECMKKVIQYISNNRKSLAKLLKYVGQNSFTEHYVKYSVDAARALAKKKGNKLSLKDELLIKYNAAGAAEVYTAWLLNERNITEEDVIEIITNSMTDNVKMLYLK